MPQNYKLTSVTRAFDDADQYGNITWSVGMEGASDHALLKTRPDNEPKVGDVVFGELQPTKSGKATWLKKKKRDDYPQQSSGAVASSSSPAGQAQQLQERDIRIRNQVIFKGAIDIWTRGGEKGIVQSVSDAIDIMEAVESQIESRADRREAEDSARKADAAERYNKMMQEDSAKEVEDDVPF